MSDNSIYLKAFGASDQGLMRQENQDRFHIDAAAGLALVSDGMGGEQAGTLAAQVVAQALPAQLAGDLESRTSAVEPAEAAVLLAGAMMNINDLLLAQTRAQPHWRGMGATVVACLRVGTALAVAHLGDSRLYLWRRGWLERLTRDHTLAELLLDSGHISPHQYRQHPGRNTLTRHIGKEDCAAPDTALLDLRPGDRLLLCTDGLTNMLTDREIAAILHQAEDQETTCLRLLERANEAGGRDNITAVLVDAVAQESCVAGRSAPRPGVRRRIGRSLLAAHWL